MSEQQLAEHLKGLASKNRIRKSFLGAGCYSHYIPAAVNHLLMRSEFYTSYTPYQAEVSQGVLQALFEFQSMICELTQQGVSNASMYDGSTALAESCFMACRITKRDEILVSDTLHPHYREVLTTYCSKAGLKLNVVESDEGGSDNIHPNEKTAATVVQSPNFFGVIEDTDAIFDRAKKAGSMSVACILEPTSLGLINPPDADITCGEGGSLGNPPSFGGPGFGFLATKMENVRHIPARIVGQTLDSEGERAYALTLQTREQHIRREKATSNICTSQSLSAIAASIYLSLLGPKGFRAVAEASHKNAIYMSKKLSEIGLKPVFDKPIYNEFLSKVPKDAHERISNSGFEPGLDISKDYSRYSGSLLFALTEQITKKDIDSVLEALG
jgi:glycine dehydrogenase subunit 1